MPARGQGAIGRLATLERRKPPRRVAAGQGRRYDGWDSGRGTRHVEGGLAMSRLVDFYRGEATDREGRFLRDLWAWGDDDLEAVHDFIQWLFPLPEPSRYNPDAPLLTDENIAPFRAH